MRVPSPMAALAPAGAPTETVAVRADVGAAAAAKRTTGGAMRMPSPMAALAPAGAPTETLAVRFLLRKRGGPRRTLAQGREGNQP